MTETVELTLPDGARKEFAPGVTGAEVAGAISRSLARQAMAIKIDGEIRDLAMPIERDAAVEIITRDSAEGLTILRHDAAHVMAQAVQEIYPDAQVTIGPAIAEGFYYDFARPEPFSSDDLARIEEKMREIVQRDAPFTREVWDRQAAIDHFRALGEAYKAEIIADLPEEEEVTLYRQGDWMDLCRGPHGPSTGRVGQAFKLTKLAGAYWRGDSDREMLQRIYGTAWAHRKDLDAYLERLAEAERRDHRRLGRELGLFHFQEEAPGQVFWHPRGWTVFLALEAYIRRRLAGAGYREINTPQLVESTLFERSGHWDKFGDELFVVRDEDKQRAWGLKPMNCPCHVQIYNQGIKSYRDLPLRLAEFGTCMRDEPHGARHGLLRVTSMTQDDAHIFCTPAQIEEEIVGLAELIKTIYADFGFEEIYVKFSDRPEARVGADSVWDHAEAALKSACEAAALEWVLNPGEGAFYGPKLEFVLKDAIGRDWQCGTVQLDFNLPGRLGAEYTDESGARQTPVMIHRALIGTFERFMGILIEEFAGRFPLWLAPVQAVLATVTSDADAHAKAVAAAAARQGLRVETDLRNEKIGYKIREHSDQKIPAILVVGRGEAEAGTVTIRRLGRRDQETLPVEEALARLAEEATPPDLRDHPPATRQAAE